MAKNIRRMLAMVLVMCMFVSALPMQALAAEGDEPIPQTETVTEGPITNENGDTVTTTTTTSTDNSGNTTVTVEVQTESPISNGNSTVTVETQTESTITSGNTTVNSGENTSSTTVQYKDEEGEVVRTDKIAESSSSYTETNTSSESGTSSTYVEEGQEWSKESMDIPEPGVKLDIPLTEDDPSTEAKENVNSETFGDPAGTKEVIDGEKPSEGDTNYEYTETTVLEQGKVTVTTKDVNITETYDEETLNKNDLEYVRSETVPNGDINKLEGTNDLVYASGHAPEEYLPGYEGDPVPPEGIDGYDYVYVGSGATSMLVPAIVFDKEALTDEEKLERWGNKAYLKYDHRNYSDMVPDGVTVAGKDAEGYALDADGNRIVRREMSTVGPDGKTIYYLDRIDRISSNYLVEGWYEVGQRNEETGRYEDGKWVEKLNGEKGFYAVWAGPQQFTLVDKDGKVITAYCADSTTPTQDTYGYNIKNLEDATYYTDEQAEMIRSIAANGYWGSVGNKTDADGNEILDESGKPIPKTGSLEAMKASLLASGKFTEKDLESLTDGVALTATQMAIWSNSNKMSGIQFINAHYSEWGIPDYKTQFYKDSEGKYTIPNPNYNPELAKIVENKIPTEKEDEVDLMFRIYDYLMALAPTPAVPEEEDANTENTVINADNFLESMDVTVIKKDESHANNSDAYDDNDAYVTTLSFSLAVVPARDIDGNLNENDDLVVILRDKEGKVMATGRIAGDKKDGEIDMRDVTDNNYSFENITMVEGDQKFTLNLSGIQHLKEGVYLYTSEVRTVEEENVSSQTLVGLAGGDRGVNVAVDIEFNLQVDGVVAKEHVYHYEGDPSTPPRPPRTPRTPRTPPEPPTPNNPPQIFRLNNDDLEEIPEEPVPLATPVVTGDNSDLWVAVILFALCGIVAVNIFDKKRQHESF